MNSGIRWACNFSKWEPTERELLLATSCIQPEEKVRLDKFVFKRDFKSSLVGRLMMRKFISESTKIPYDRVRIERDENNKPIYMDSDDRAVSFNVSHHGSFTVLAGEMGRRQVGIDVMKLEYGGGKRVKEFFRLMDKNFSMQEWNKIKGTSDKSEKSQIETFCRNWALKESYVKAVGIGLTTDLSKISFDIVSDLSNDKITTDTCLYIGNEKQDWVFEESLLDPLHCVAVALDKKCSSSTKDPSFEHITPVQLLENSIPLLPQDIDYCNRFFLHSLA